MHNIENKEQLIDEINNRNIVISLLLTDSCNFKCKHCMYSCVEKKNPKFISDKILNKIHCKLDKLQQEENINFSINLIGGEPTLDLDKFEHILNMVYEWEYDISITTNGWWLHNIYDTKKFFKIVKPYVSYNYVEKLNIRISNDRFHMEFRPNTISKKLKEHLSNLLEYGSKENLELCVDEYEVYCENCNETYYFNNDNITYVCPKCGEDLDEFDYKTNELSEIKVDNNYPWIYVDQYDYNPIPIGRGKNVHNKNHINYITCDFSGLTFSVDGKVTDICCKGSDLNYGTVDDDLLFLMYLGLEYTKNKKNNCRYCRRKLKNWVNENLNLYKYKYSEIIKEY